MAVPSVHKESPVERPQHLVLDDSSGAKTQSQRTRNIIRRNALKHLETLSQSPLSTELVADSRSANTSSGANTQCQRTRNIIKRDGRKVMVELEEEQSELSEVKIEIDVAEEPSEYWMTDQPPQDALIDSAVKIESGCDGNVLDGGSCHVVEPMVVKTEVKEETDTDWDVNPAFSHTADATAAERSVLSDSAVRLQSVGNTNVLDSSFTCHDMEPMVVKTEVIEETDTNKEAQIVQTSSDPADPPTSTSPSCFETVAGEKKISVGHHVCEVCCEEFRQASLLKKHMVLHNGRKDSVCDSKICFPTRRQNHNGHKDFVCDSKCFATQRQNLLTVNISMPSFGAHNLEFVCDICNKAFSWLSSYKRHKLIHAGRKDFVCDICNKTFARFADMERHKLVHSGRKDFFCDICNRGFTQASSLKTHKLIHTGKKDFVCDTCDRAFMWRSCLKSHQKTHTSYNLNMHQHR